MSHSGGNKAKAISVKGNLVWKESNSIVCHVVMMMISFLCHRGIKIPMIIPNQAVIIMISRRKKGVGCQENHHHCHKGNAQSADVSLRNPEGPHRQLSSL